MQRPADKEILDFIGNGSKCAKDIYEKFGAKTNSDKCVIYRALNSLVRYKFVERTGGKSMFWYRRV